MVICVNANVQAYDQGQTKAYYDYVYKAEQCVIQKDYRTASKYYDTAFSLDIKPFATDIHNSAICAAYNKDNTTLLYRAEMLIDKGGDLRYFNKKQYEEFRKSAQYQKLIKEMPALLQQRYEHLDTALINNIKLFCDRTAIINTTEFKDANDVKYVAGIKKQDDSINERLYLMMEQNDYLSEELIGAFDDSAPSSQPLYGELINDQFQKYPAAMRRAVANAVQKGKLRANTGADWLILHSDRPRLRYIDDYMMIGDTLWVLDQSIKLKAGVETVELLADIDDARFFRLSYYMDEPTNIVEKLKFNYHNYLKYKRKEEATPFYIFEPLMATDHVPNHAISFKIVDVP